MLLYLDLLTWTVWLLPAWSFWMLLLALGLGWLLAALQVFLRDTAQVLSVVLVFWFWFTPIFYRVDMAPPRFQPWLQLNPLTHVVEGYRLLLLEGRVPAPESWLALAGFSLADVLPGRPGLQGDEAGVRRCPLSRLRW